MVKWEGGGRGKSQLYSVPVPQEAFPLSFFPPACLSAVNTAGGQLSGVLSYGAVESVEEHWLTTDGLGSSPRITTHSLGVE